MIRTFRDRDTERLFRGERVPSLEGIAERAERKLRLIDASDRLTALANLPSNRFKKLKGQREGQYSIRINEQWRVCFEWHDGDAYNVEITDYH